ncbi:hypothetical protein KI387_002171, partial [Taxus chinensis]
IPNEAIRYLCANLSPKSAFINGGFPKISLLFGNDSELMTIENGKMQPQIPRLLE